MCMDVITSLRTILQYSEQKNPMVSPELPVQVLASHSLLISHTLLHDMILLEARAYSLNYAANVKRKMLKRTKDLNDLIEQKIHYDVTEDMDMVEVLKQEVQDIEDERDMASPGSTSPRCSWRGKSHQSSSATSIGRNLLKHNSRSCTW